MRIPIPPEFALMEAADQRASVSAALVAVIEHASSLTQEQRESLHSAASVLPWGFEWTSRGRVIGNLGRGRYEVTIDVVGNLSITAVLDDGTRLPNYIRPNNGFGMDLLAAIDRGPFEPVFRKPEAQWSRNPRRDATAHAEEATGGLTLPEFEAVIVAWQEGPAAGEGIPDPHPAFAAHFTNPIYSDFGDEQAPFGSDEGFDALFAAAKGCEGAGADLTVRDLLEIDVVDVEEFVMGAARGSDLHQILIATGLGLIRATGRIDVEGRNWLLRALRADEEATIDDTWDDVIHSDLSTYPPV